MKTPVPLYKMMVLDTSQIIAPREHYQREIKNQRVKRIVKDFDERIANEPKVSYRDGKYYVFDGQHTIDARKVMNDGEDLPVEPLFGYISFYILLFRHWLPIGTFY